jgi:heme a synthase
MITNDKKINYYFINWLSITLILVFSIIIVGGLTRLTDSGLSITEWELFKGMLPPFSNDSWIAYFDLYKEIPQYKLLNYNMNLNEFKIIFYWEYFHRVLGRVIGIFFFIPLLYFHFISKIKNQYLINCYLIFFLIILQGIVGWYMVMSGLVNNISVSHYRLSLHLSLAFVIISTIFWLIINVKNKKYKYFFKYSKTNLPYLFLIFLLFFQIIFGAFVSGLDAGKVYQTWPLMGQSYFPNDIVTSDIRYFLDFNNHSLVQFYHRNLAYFITLYVLIIGISIYKKKNRKLYKPIKLMVFFLILQILLGILTLISGLNIILASSHQITSVLLVFSSINLYYCNIK